MTELIIQAQTSCKTPIVSRYTDPITKERKEGIEIRFASDRFNCFVSSESIYAGDEEALQKIKAFCEKRNAQFPGTYKFLSASDFAQFGDKQILGRIWQKIRHKALTNPETLSDVLSDIEIDILKRYGNGTAIGYEAPEVAPEPGTVDEAEVAGAASLEPPVSPTRPAATRGAATVKGRTPR